MRNPYSIKDSRWKWFVLGSLAGAEPDFKLPKLPEEGSPNREAYADGRAVGHFEGVTTKTAKV